MNIRSQEAFFAGVWDWGILDGCFNGKIKPTDLDGCIERNGWKLILETKQPGTPIPFGQELTLNSFVNDGHTVFVIWGKKNLPERVRIISPFHDETRDVNLEGLRDLVRKWFVAVDDIPLSRAHPERMAKVLYKTRGPDYCDRMMAEWVRIESSAN